MARPDPAARTVAPTLVTTLPPVPVGAPAPVAGQ